MFTKLFKGMRVEDITQGFSSVHPAIDIARNLPFIDNRFWGYGQPLSAPENVRIESIVGNGFTPGDNTGLERGWGVWMTGLETGLVHVYWHSQPILPVNGGDVIPRGNIVCYMGNSGKVTSGGTPVPVEERNEKPHKGTHLHWEIYPNGHKIGFFGGAGRLDPRRLINWNWEPNNSLKHQLESYAKVLIKMQKLVGKT